MKRELLFSSSVLMIMEPPLNKLETPSHLSQSCDAIFKFFLFVAMYSLSLYWFCFTLSWYSQFHLASLFLYLLYGFVSIYDHFTLLLCKIQNVSVRNASCECWIAVNKHLLSLQIEPLMSRDCPQCAWLSFYCLLKYSQLVWNFLERSIPPLMELFFLWCFAC